MNGERKEETSFFNCTAWGRQAEIINQYCRKGKQVAIDGRLQQRSWQDQNGQNRSMVDIVIERLQLLGSPGDGQGGGSDAPPAAYDQYSGYGSQAPQQGYGRGNQQAPQSQPQGQGGGFGMPEPYDDMGMMDDDDIPF